jgi:hypothetical protein
MKAGNLLLLILSYKINENAKLEQPNNGFKCLHGEMRTVSNSFNLYRGYTLSSSR